MTSAIFAALWSHWRSNPLQLLTILMGLALATALWSGVQAINAEARASYDAAAATLGEGQFDQLVPRDGQSVPQEVFVRLRTSGWLVSPVIEGRLGGVRIIGLDALSAPGNIAPDGASAGLSIQDLLSDPILFATAETAARLSGEIRVVMDPNVAPGVALTDVGTAQNLLGRDDLSRFILLPEQPRARLELSDIAPELRLQPSRQSSDIGALTDSFHLNLTAFGLLSFAVGLFIVHSAIGLAFEQRRALVRTLRALGVPLGRLIACLVGEMALLAGAGGVLGIVLGYVLAASLLPDVALALRGLYGAEVSGALQFRSSWWLSGLAIAFLGSAFAAAGRIHQIARLPLLASARPRAWALVSRDARRIQTLLAAALLVLAALLTLFGKGLVAGFTMLACLFVGAALFLPIVVDTLLRAAAARARGAIAHWFWADTRQQLPGLSLALMALLLAIAANIGVSTMVSSFRLTFVSFLDQRLAPELYIRLDAEADPEVAEAVFKQEAREVLPLLVRDARVEGLPAEIFGVRVGPTYRQNWVFIDASSSDPWSAVADGSGAVVNEQLARRAGLWVGDALTLPDASSVTITGVVGDYGNPLAQVVLSEAAFLSRYPDVVPRQYGLRTDDAAALRARLVERLGLSDSEMINQASIKAFSLEVFERTFLVTGALNVLTLGVAGFAILMSLLTLADLRVPQLSPVWAMGLTRRALGGFELARALALATTVVLCAIPLGLVLAWALLNIVNVAAFGWQLPMFFFPVDYAVLGGWALAAATLAAAWPAWRLSRRPPAALLRVFANER